VAGGIYAMAARHFIGWGQLGSVWACSGHLDAYEACFLDPDIHKQALKNSFFDRVFEDAQT
jgi:hypothetical protein